MSESDFERQITDAKGVLFDADESDHRGTRRDDYDDDKQEFGSPTQKDIMKKSKKGQSTLMNLFLPDEESPGKKKRGGKGTKDYKSKLEYEEKLKKLPGLIGKDNIARLKD